MTDVARIGRYAWAELLNIVSLTSTLMAHLSPLLKKTTGSLVETSSRTVIYLNADP